MLCAALCLGAAVLMADAPVVAGSPTAEDRQVYESAAKLAGRDADAQARLAIWCEAHGMMTERARHLALAVLADPNHRVARGLLGQVEDNGKWRRPDQVAESVKANEPFAKAMAEYRAKRDRTPATADAHWKLALWCEANGLNAQAQSHLATVIRIDPSRAEAWKRLGYKKRDKQWMTDEQYAARKAEAEAQKKAEKFWLSRLANLKDDLAKPRKHDQAEDALIAVDDPRAVSAVLRVFLISDPMKAVQLLGQIDATTASRALALIAVHSEASEVRRAATETLRRRDPREFADILISLLRDPIRYEVRPVGGPGSAGVLLIGGKQANLRRVYAPAPAPMIPLRPTDWIGPDEQGLPVIHRVNAYLFTGMRQTGASLLALMTNNNPTPDSAASPILNHPALQGMGPVLANAVSGVSGNPLFDNSLRSAIEHVQKTENANPSQFGFGLRGVQFAGAQIPIGQMRLEAQKAAMAAQNQLQADVAALDRENSVVSEANEQITSILSSVSGQNLKADRQTWQAWYVDQLGYSYHPTPEPPRPMINQVVPFAAQPVPINVVVTPPLFTSFVRMSCFGAGTLVQTRMGAEPIETLKVGDEVLTQDAESGALRYQPIVLVHHNPPSETLRVEFADGSVVASTFHRFWIAGHGWKMARELESGDMVRGLNGTQRVVKIETDAVQPVFNLDVAGDHSFFVGKQPVLVRDNTVPSTRLAPFDAVANLE